MKWIKACASRSISEHRTYRPNRAAAAAAYSERLPMRQAYVKCPKDSPHACRMAWGLHCYYTVVFIVVFTS